MWNKGLTKFVFIVCTFSVKALFVAESALAQSEEIDCSTLVGEDAIDTKNLQAECFQLNIGWYNAQRQMIEARKAYLQSRVEFEKVKREAEGQAAPKAPKAEVKAPVRVEPTWPEFVYSTTDQTGEPVANVVYRATGETIRLKRGSSLADGARVTAIFEKGFQLVWNGQQRIVGKAG